MPSFAQILSLAALATVASANAILGRAASAGLNCPSAQLKNQASVNVNGSVVTLTSFQCAPTKPKPVVRRGLVDSLLCILLGTCNSEHTGTQTPTNVCGATCTNTCNTLAGPLPPVSDDCQQIKDAIQIFQGVTTTFVVDPNHVEALTYQTCTYFFQNYDVIPLEYCWSDLSVTASRAASACFPPVQPLNSEGLCFGARPVWAVGAAHS